MKEEEKVRIKNGISVISLIVLALVAVLLLLSSTRQIFGDTGKKILLILFLIFYWVMSDVVEPKLLHELKDMSAEKKRNYLTFAAVDLVGCAALMYFVIHVRENTYGLAGAVVYIFCLNIKKKAKAKFYKHTENE